MDGLDILKQWRSEGRDEPVLILTARDALEQRVGGLQQGADDYLCKPFAPAEVAARLQALIRRRYGQLSEKLVLGDVEMDPVAMTVTRNGVPVSLKGKELALLALFLRNPQKVLSRAMIEEKLYNWDEDVSSNAVEVHIHHLRRKLGRGFIKTIHGVGYVAGKMMKTYSLRLRLGGLLLLLTLLTWGVASMFARMQTTKSINELFDTQQMAFAKRLSVLPSGSSSRRLPYRKPKNALRQPGKQDDDAFAFAIFSPSGERVLDDGENGRKIPFSDKKNGFGTAR